MLFYCLVWKLTDEKTSPAASPAEPQAAPPKRGAPASTWAVDPGTARDSDNDNSSARLPLCHGILTCACYVSIKYIHCLIKALLALKKNP
jgi:hypothetical protein